MRQPADWSACLRSEHSPVGSAITAGSVPPPACWCPPTGSSAGSPGGGWFALGLIPSLVITTIGRRSGKPRSNPLLYVPDGDAYVVIGSNWGQTQQPAWSLNLLAEPTAEVDVRGRRIPVRAVLATGAERDRLWQLLVTEWPAYRAYVERAGDREIRVFRLEPTGRGAPAEPRSAG